ncbi:MAG TPA: alpha/beta hydrolase [Candidatus Limnocylindria bacterium]|nr:alpha/beta hydrolase [Candidatus Limnocylindria bacterium]
MGLELASLVRHPVYRGEGVEDADGQPVLLIPGFLAGDDSLGLMARWLRRTGHYTRRAGMRSNVDCSEAAVGRIEERVTRLAERQGRRVALIGQSRGGSFARVIAARRPDLVSGIVALGSPQLDPMAIHPLVRLPVFAVGALGTVGAPGLFGRSCRDGDCCRRFWEDMQVGFPSEVGYVSIYSRRDGIVDWRACLDPAAECVEIRTSHCGMAVSPHAYRAIAEALAAFRRRDRSAQGRPAEALPRAA